MGHGIKRVSCGTFGLSWSIADLPRLALFEKGEKYVERRSFLLSVVNCLRLSTAACQPPYSVNRLTGLTESRSHLTAPSTTESEVFQSSRAQRGGGPLKARGHPAAHRIQPDEAYQHVRLQIMARARVAFSQRDFCSSKTAFAMAAADTAVGHPE
jgi:hypothetical protein